MLRALLTMVAAAFHLFSVVIFHSECDGTLNATNERDDSDTSFVFNFLIGPSTFIRASIFVSPLLLPLAPSHLLAAQFVSRVHGQRTSERVLTRDIALSRNLNGVGGADGATNCE